MIAYSSRINNIFYAHVDDPSLTPMIARRGFCINNLGIQITVQQNTVADIFNILNVFHLLLLSNVLIHSYFLLRISFHF